MGSFFKFMTFFMLWWLFLFIYAIPVSLIVSIFRIDKELIISLMNKDFNELTILNVDWFIILAVYLFFSIKSIIDWIKTKFKN